MGVALPEAFADWNNPTPNELNGSLSFDLTPALVETGTKFELAASTADTYLPFNAPTEVHSLTFYQPTVVYEMNRSMSATAQDQSNVAYQLLEFADVEYFAWLRIGKDPALPFTIGDRVSLVRVATDWPVDNVSIGKNVTMTQAFLPVGDLLWSHTINTSATDFVTQVNISGSGSLTASPIAKVSTATSLGGSGALSTIAGSGYGLSPYGTNPYGDPTLSIVDNGDGTYTGYGAIADNGDGTYSITDTITDAGSGVLSFTG